jgi:phosphoribosyl 1,2-cyclic phosphodiesterase/tetratricopeptide (TPR) repeat protein/anti-anti-sigma regulatory factor
MKIKIWGARGSLPSPIKPEEIQDKIFQAIFGMPPIDTNDPEEVWDHISELPLLIRGTAGGNTSCIEVQAGDEFIIIDAGSGIRDLGQELLKGPCGQGKGVIHLFFSHAHWDHIQGFPFFRPAFVPGNKVFIYSVHDLRQALDGQQQPLTFPVPLAYIQAQLEFVQLEPGRPLSIGKVRVNSIKNPHPGDAYSFRFEDEHSTFVYASDAEFKQLDDASVQPHIEFFRNADALIFDAQYTLKEAWLKVDWGHSSAMIGVDLARAARVKKLILYHHDPSYSDAELLKIQSTAIAYQAQDTTRPTCEILVAYEGMILDLTPPGAVELQLMADRETAILTPTSIFDERGVDRLIRQLSNLNEQESYYGSIIDLSQVETLTTASLKLLVALRRDEENAPIVLAGPSESALRVIKLGGYMDFFAIYPSVETALAALKARKALNLPGQVIKGRYKIEKKLGDGPLGTVVQAIDMQTNRPVALKVLSPAFSPETIDRFMRQAGNIMSLEHPHIAKVLDVDKDGHICFIVEELIEGQTLAQLYQSNNGPISADQALDIALDITLALEYAHSRGVTHGYLKPQNIFITDYGIKLSDIGLGRLEEGRNLLNAPILQLTAAYLAPEQILGQPLDARTDLYALGVILYQLFTYRLPFHGTDREVMLAHLHEAPRPPRNFTPHISPSLEHLILKLLVKNPNARYASAEQARRISSSLIVNVGDGKQQQYRNDLVGRSEQLKLLQGCWDEAKAGRGQMVLITGEAGIGKTTLARYAALQVDPAVLLVGHCLEPAGSPVYHPFIEALRSYFATVPPELFDDEARQLISNFTRLVPEIRAVLPDLPEPTPLEPKQEQLRLMSTLTQFIKRATAERAWLLILDDLQWADHNSLELLRYLSHYLPVMSLLIIGTYRVEEVDRGHPLRELIRALSVHPYFRNLLLDRLDREGVDQVLSHIWRQPAPPALTERIYQHTEGNPFYVEEVAKTLVDDGLIILQQGQWHFPVLEEVRLPRTVREAVWRRIHYLSPDTQSLLRQAAVLGQTFKFEDLLEMSGQSEWEVLEHLDVALERQLLQEAAGADETLLHFRHPEIQQVLYTEMGMLRRRMLHHQAGEALTRRAMPEPSRIAEKLAYHYSEADEFEKALVYSIQAARQAQAAHANEAALLWYNRTLEMIDQLAPEEIGSFQPLRLPVHRHLGEVLTLVGRYDEALEQYAQARILVEAEPPSIERSHILANLISFMAEVYEKRSEYDAALKWVHRGLSYLYRDEVSLEAARLYLIGARTFDHQGQLDKAMDWCQQSLMMASQISTPLGQQITAQAYARLSAISLQRGNYDLAVPFSQESIQLYEQIDDVAGQVAPYIYLGIGHFYLGNWVEAGEAFNKSLDIAREIGDVDGQSRASNNLALIYMARGDWEQAQEIFEQNCAIWKQIGMAKDEAKTLNKLAQLHTYKEELSEAQSCLTRSQMIFEEVGADDYRPELERSWGAFYLHSGQLDQALSHIQRSITLAEQQHNPLEEAKSYRLLGKIHLARQEPEQAGLVLQHSLDTLTRLESKYEVAKTRLWLAKLALINQSMAEAQENLQRAKAVFEKLKAQADLPELHKLETVITI